MPSDTTDAMPRTEGRPHNRAEKWRKEMESCVAPLGSSQPKRLGKNGSRVAAQVATGPAIPCRDKRRKRPSAPLAICRRHVERLSPHPFQPNQAPI